MWEGQLAEIFHLVSSSYQIKTAQIISFFKSGAAGKWSQGQNFPLLKLSTLY